MSSLLHYFYLAVHATFGSYLPSINLSISNGRWKFVLTGYTRDQK